MADDKKKEGDGKEAPKKGKSPLIMIVVGAVLGGAGVTFALPPKEVEVKHEEPVLQSAPVHHPDLMDFKFNPRTQAGKGYAHISFYFVYTVREDLEAAALKAVEANWPRAYSNVLELLMARTKTELDAENGRTVLRRDLEGVLDSAFFPAHGEEKVATITEILWKDWLLQ